MSKYYDTLYAKNQRLVLFGVVVDKDKVSAEIGYLGDFLPSEVSLFASHESFIDPVATVDLDKLSGLPSRGSSQDLTLTRK